MDPTGVGGIAILLGRLAESALPPPRTAACGVKQPLSFATVVPSSPPSRNPAPLFVVVVDEDDARAVERCPLGGELLAERELDVIGLLS